MTYQKFEALLTSLQENGHISYYDDNCTSKEINYTVKFQRTILAEKIKRELVSKMFKIGEAETENLTCLDENGKLIIFKNVTDLINYFVKFRLGFYDKRKAYALQELADQHKILTNRARFIKMIIDGKLKVNNRPKADIVIDLEKAKFDQVSESFDYLLNMPIHSLTKERYEDLLKQVIENENETIRIKAILPMDMYKSDLVELRKKLVK
jgi:DNA topoisomerase-2